MMLKHVLKIKIDLIIIFPENFVELINNRKNESDPLASFEVIYDSTEAHSVKAYQEMVFLLINMKLLRWKKHWDIVRTIFNIQIQWILLMQER